MAHKHYSYNDFFNEMMDFKQKQSQQKMRGLNDYNILTTVLKPHDEVRLHSRMISSLLDTNGKHYQNSLFLESFLSVLGLNNFNLDFESTTVQNEFLHIDIYITDGTKHIIIENKIYADDQSQQIKRYIDNIYNLYPQTNYEDVIVIYLSIDRMSPSDYSLGDFSINDNDILNSNNEKKAGYKSMHYKSDILNWLYECKSEVQNITNLNEVFDQYIQVVEKITNQYKGHVMTLKDEMKKNRDQYLVAQEIIKNMPVMKRDIIKDFFDEVVERIQDKLGNSWIVEKKDEKFASRYGFPLRIYKKEWSDKNFLLFGFEFDANNYYDGRFGIVKNNKDINMQDISNSFFNDINAIDVNFNTTTWWLFQYKIPGKKDFVEQILFDDYSANSFIANVYDYINKIEIEHKLLTNINNYINKNIVS